MPEGPGADMSLLVRCCARVAAFFLLMLVWLKKLSSGL